MSIEVYNDAIVGNGNNWVFSVFPLQFRYAQSDAELLWKQ